MVCCSVFECKNNDNKSSVKRWRFFTFPKDKILSKQWIKSCSRKDKINIKYARVCSEHFLETDFTNLKDELLNVPLNKRKLNCNSVPSVKLSKPNKPVKEETERAKRFKKKQQSEMCNFLINDSIKATTNDTDIMCVEENCSTEKKMRISKTETWSDASTHNYTSDSEEVQNEICFVSVNEEQVNESDACENNTALNSKSKLNSNNKCRKKNKYPKITETEEEFEIALLNLVFERPPLFDHTLPIKQRLTDIIDKLWEEVSDELSKYGTFNKSELIGLWRPLRDNYTKYKNSLKNVCSNDSTILPQPKYADILKQLDNIIDTRRLTDSTKTDTSMDICSSDSHYSIPMISKSSITIHSCRACLSNDGTLSIFEQHNNLLIDVMISDLTNEKTNVAEGFLKTICKSCVEKLYAAFIFKQEYENSEKKLKHFLFQDISSKEEPNNISETEFTETDSYIELDHDTDDLNMKAKVSLQIEFVGISVEDKLSENYECEFCFQSFENEQSLVTHKDIIHKEEGKCEYSKKISPLYKSAQQYTQIIEEEKVNSIGISEEKELQLEETMELQCNICFKHFLNNGTLKCHMRRHETPKFICEICSKPYWNKCELLQHQRLIHLREKPYKCVECNRSFFLERSLKMHNFIHTGEKPFKCQYCDKTFRHISSKIIHTKLHTGDNKRHQCEICLKRFSFPCYLRIHKRKHTGEKPFKCQYCNLRFVQKFALEIHLRIHNGVTPFKCHICEKGFTRNAGLKRHVKIHTGEKPFECMFCNNKYGNVSNQRAHTNHYCKSNPNMIRKNTTNL